MSDIHLDQTTTHVMDISPLKADRRNDLDYLTYERLISEVDYNIKSGIVAQPKFILILGDIVGHTRYSSETTLENETTVFKVLKDTFPNTPILYTFGNNDSLKINYGPFIDSGRSEYKSPYDVAKKAAGWSNGFLSTGILCAEQSNYPCMISEDTTNGYYAAYLESHFRLISLNSVLFSVHRKTTEQEANNQLKWLESQLELAKTNQESVLIAMHVPPGNNILDHSGFWSTKDQVVFLKLMKTYQHIITGLLASHTHTEELKIIQDNTQNNIAGIYLAPGLSTSHGNEPSVKTFYFSRENEQWQLSNYEVFHFSLDKANLVFNKLYDYLSYYCINQENKLSQCLSHVTAEKMDKYLAAGNKNYAGGVIRSLKDIILNA